MGSSITILIGNSIILIGDCFTILTGEIIILIGNSIILEGHSITRSTIGYEPHTTSAVCVSAGLISQNVFNN